MCELRDFEHLDLLPEYRKILESELGAWHRDYLPRKRKFRWHSYYERFLPEGQDFAESHQKLGTVLDAGAGCGETVQFYLNHGAERVIAIEDGSLKSGAIDCLRRNFGSDPRVTIVEARLSMGKIDIEGWEEGWFIETHGTLHFKKIATSATLDGWRIESDNTLTRRLRHRLLPNKLTTWLHARRVHTAHWIRVNLLR